MASDQAPLTSDELDAIYRVDVHPVVFDTAPAGQEHPILVLLGGQPGAGKSRAAARLAAEHPGMAALTGDDLRIFHPDYRALVTEQHEHALQVLAESTRAWVRAALQDALDERRSLLLEGSFGDPDATLTTAARFHDAGFQVRIAAIASPRVLSVISAASRYLRDRKAGTPARFTRLFAHDRGYDGTTRLVERLDESSPADRVTIISRNGNILFDQAHGDDQAGFNDASTALHQGRHPESWGARSTMELLGELKQITGYAIASGQLSRPLAELLIEAHDLALAEVTPRLSIDADSPQAKFILEAVTEQLVALRRAAYPEIQSSADLATSLEVGAAQPEIH